MREQGGVGRWSRMDAPRVPDGKPEPGRRFRRSLARLVRLWLIPLSLLALAAIACGDGGNQATTPSATSDPGSTATGPASGSRGRADSSVASVQAAAETQPVGNGGDAADDIAIWVHPSNPGLSTIIGTDKEGGGILVYNLDGSLLQQVPAGRINNVDIRGGFRLAGSEVSIVVGTNRPARTTDVFRVDAASRRLVPLSATGNGSDTAIYGVCMYHSPASGKFYAIVTGNNHGLIRQYEISSAGSDAVRLELVRTLSLSSQAEGCVADDQAAILYLAEEETGIWRFDAEPDGSNEGVLIDRVRSGNLSADVEGLTLYYAGPTEGYLIASSQGNDSFAVYDRVTNAYLGSFRIGDGAIDGVSETDGIDVTNAGLGAAFPQGVFVAQDDSNRDAGGRANQNFKLVPWPAIAAAFDPPLAVETAPLP